MSIRARTPTARLLQACVVPVLLAGVACSRPEPPPTDQPPEPQAGTAVADAGGERHTRLRDAIQHPIDKAKAVEDVTLEAAERQRAEIDAQTGN